MTISNCETKFNCTGIAIVASLILGIIAAFLQITAVLTIPPILFAGVVIIALVYLAVALIAISLTHTSTTCRTLCSVLSVLLFGILGSVLFAVILLIIDVAATSVIGSILVGLLAFSFSLLLMTTACLIKCIARCDD